MNAVKKNKNKMVRYFINTMFYFFILTILFITKIVVNKIVKIK